MSAPHAELSPVNIPSAWLMPSVAAIAKTLGVLQERLAYSATGTAQVATLEAAYTLLLENLAEGEDITLDLFTLVQMTSELQKATTPLRAEELPRAA